MSRLIVFGIRPRTLVLVAIAWCCTCYTVCESDPEPSTRTEAADD